MSAGSDIEMLSPRQNRRRRQALSSPPCFSTSPADSGYGSADPSPVVPVDDPDAHPTPENHLYRSNELWMLGDGNGSEDLDEDSPIEPEGEERVSRYQYFRRSPSPTIAVAARRMGSIIKRRKPHTLPVRSSGLSRPRLPDSFVSESSTTIPRRRSNIGLYRRRAASLRAYDRFIPSRTQSAETVTRYRTGKEWTELTPRERLLRHNAATEDAFIYRRRIMTPMAADYRLQSRSDGVASRRVGNVLGPLDQNTSDGLDRHVSNGTIWAVGGLAPGGTAVNNGRGQLVRSGTNARLFRTSFRTSNPKQEDDDEKHEARLAAALGLDRTQRTLATKIPSYVAAQHPLLSNTDIPTQWNGSEWVKEGTYFRDKFLESRILPGAPFKVLDAPNLRDDFYCSILAYSPTCKTLAVGLGNLLYGWSETRGVKLLHAGSHDDAHLTSVDFSSTQGGRAILAFGRTNSSIGLMSLLDDPDVNGPDAALRTAPLPRFEVDQPAPVTCLAWKPTVTMRPSKCPSNPGRMVETEDLLVGEDTGCVYYYTVEWPDKGEYDRHDWPGYITLLARINNHTQQICGLSWSPPGSLFATGGNDNLCYLYDTAEVLEQALSTTTPGEHNIMAGTRLVTRSVSPDPSEFGQISEINYLSSSDTPEEYNAPYDLITDERRPMREIRPGDEKHCWKHRAAVKAIAFCPWQDGLVATGGGSNDKCIHFFHTTSGAALATIFVAAQVTSLIWSTTRREIAATFGYAQPEHAVRIAVFSWPDCNQVAAIPWTGDHRALYAIPYPGGPDSPGEGRTGSSSRTAMEGCIMVASSDKSVKFHEVWSADKRATAGGVGMLGGSDILESLEGIYREGVTIR